MVVIQKCFEMWVKYRELIAPSAHKLVFQRHSVQVIAIAALQKKNARWVQSEVGRSLVFGRESE